VSTRLDRLNSNETLNFGLPIRTATASECRALYLEPLDDEEEELLWSLPEDEDELLWSLPEDEEELLWSLPEDEELPWVLPKGFDSEECDEEELWSEPEVDDPE
jgi:hypothetical protein